MTMSEKLHGHSLAVYRIAHTHDVGLGPDGNKTVDVFLDGHQHLASHVAALLGAGGLVLDVDACRTLLNEELGELHDRRETAMASVGVGNDRSKIVDAGQLGALSLGCGEAFLALLPVVEELRIEKLANLVGYSGLECDVVRPGKPRQVSSQRTSDSRKGSQPGRDQARRLNWRSKTIATRTRRRCRDTWPSASPWWAPSSHRCSWHPYSNN